VRVVAWNVRSGGTKRGREIALALHDLNAEIAVLGEYRTTGSQALLEELERYGFKEPTLTSPLAMRGGLAIASTVPLRRVPLPESLSQFESRFLEVEVPGKDLRIVGLYGLLEDEPFADFWRAVLAELRERAAQPTLVIGDLNTGESMLDAPQKNFYCSKYFSELPSLGYIDLWRRQHGRERKEFSYYGRVNGYRLDHAFGSDSLTSRVLDCRYSHGEREAGLSDHSPLLVQLGESAA
jgi:exodeoxyribonuclease III